MPVILILGVTASGKSSASFKLAEKLSAEIISIDSMKVYRRMDIGTAKPSLQQRSLVPHHLIDIIEPQDSFSVDQFLSLADSAIEDIKSRNRPVIASGGTAMYIKALLYGIFDGPGTDESIRNHLKKLVKEHSLAYLHQKLKAVDPQAAQRIHPNDEKRLIRALEVFELTGKPISQFQNQFDAQKPRHNWTIIGLRRQKQQENSRINLRVKMMIQQGLVDEVKKLTEEYPPVSAQAASAIGYAEIIDYLSGEFTLEKAVEKIKINTRRFAKSQRTWFKTFKNVNWIDVGQDDSLENIVRKIMIIVEKRRSIE